jgi:opacity protein-like surface antigen
MRSFLISSACAASLMLALTPEASAADVDYRPEPGGPSWYVSIFGGWSLPDDLDVDFDGLYSSTEFSGSIDLDNGFMAGIAAGGRFTPWLRADVEFSGHWHDFGGEELETSAGSSVPVENDDVNALFVLANLWIDVPVGEMIRPYIGGGAGMGRLEADVSTTGGKTFINDSDWGFAYQLGAGIAFDLTPNMVVDVGYRFKAINAEFEVDDLFAATDTDADYRSHNVLLGLRFEFCPGFRSGLNRTERVMAG